MKAFKVKLKNAEKAKEFLLNKETYDKSYLPKKEKNYILFPVKKKVETEIEGEYVNTELKKTDKINTYKELLTDLTEKEKNKLPSSYDIIGDIIIIEIPQELESIEKDIGEALIQTHKNVKTVLKKAGIHSGEFRTQKLEYLAGENKKETIYKENNTRLKLDVEKTYFSPRLSSERKRIYEKVKKGEKVLVMFSGVGPYPIVLSKNTKAEKIIGIEKNSVAHKYALKNKKLNKAENVEFLHGDVRELVPTLNEKYDRIIMPLPKDAEKFLDLLHKVAKENTIIHVYVFEETEEKAKKLIEQESQKEKISCEIHHVEVCGQYSPSHYRMCVDLEVHAH